MTDTTLSADELAQLKKLDASHIGISTAVEWLMKAWSDLHEAEAERDGLLEWMHELHYRYAEDPEVDNRNDNERLEWIDKGIEDALEGEPI